MKITTTLAEAKRGYALITVLILTLVASTVVFVSIRENQLQERMSGNQQKMINARLLAEKGVYESIVLLKNGLTQQSTTAQLQTSLTRTEADYQVSNVNYNAPIFSLISKGGYQDATAYLKANLSVDNGIAPFDAGVISCQTLEVQGSGQIDSYDPANGGYDRNTAGRHADNAKVEVLNSGSNINKLDGASPIRGDVKVNGNVEVQGSAEITGAITVSQNLNMSGGGTKIGSANVGGNLTMSSSAQIVGAAQVVGNVDANNQTKVGSLSYGGTLTTPQQSGLTATNGTIANQMPSAQTIQNKSCDPLNITTAFAGYNNLTSAGSIGNYHWQKTSYNMTPTSAEVYRNDNDKNSTTITNSLATTADVFGENKEVHVLDSLSLESSTLNISGGDVTIIVKGDFNTSGGQSAINVSAGSSLTVLVMGKTQLQSDGKLNVSDAGAGVNNGKSPISIYSSYSGSQGVRLDGAFNGGYAAIYAPLTDAKIEGSGTLSGAVRAKTLTVRGAGGLHYDESLGAVKQAAGPVKVSLTSLVDYYP
jgi:hypothetical protein